MFTPNYLFGLQRRQRSQRVEALRGAPTQGFFAHQGRRIQPSRAGGVGSGLAPVQHPPHRCRLQVRVPMERPEGAEVDDEQDVANLGYVLQGVKFRAVSGLGPSDTRPWYLREVVAVRDRRVAPFLAAVAGELCDAARCFLGSHLVFSRKKFGAKNRPIRVGEFGRRVIAKRLVHASRQAV